MGHCMQVHSSVPLVDIAEIMANSDIAVVPKRVSSGFGNEAASTKILQFMALGVPVIVSRSRVDSYYFDDSVVQFFEPEDRGQPGRDDAQAHPRSGTAPETCRERLSLRTAAPLGNQIQGIHANCLRTGWRGDI